MLRRLIDDERARTRWPAAAVALLFALHPLRVEPVAWISERKELQGAFFGFLTLLAYAEYARHRRGLTTRGRRAVKAVWYLATLGLFAVGIFSKPTVVTIPCVMLLLDHWPLRRFPWTGTLPLDITDGDAPDRSPAGAARSPSPVGWLLVEKLPFVALVAISASMTFVAQKQGGAMAMTDVSPLTDRMANAAVSYVRYLGKMAWFGNLATPYPRPPAWPAWEVAGSVGLLVAFTATAILLSVGSKRRGWRARPWVGVGWLWFLGTLVPMIGVIQVGDQAMADRYSYIPSVGLFVALVWLGREGLARFAAVVWGRRISAGGAAGRTSEARGSFSSAGLVVAIAAALSYFSRRQLTYWRDTAALFGHTIEVTEHNGVAYYELGMEFKRDGNWPQAEAAFRGAVEATPHDVMALTNLSVAVDQQGRHQEALDYATRAIESDTRHASAYSAAGNSLVALGRTAEAEKALERAVELAPDDARADFALGSILPLVGQPARGVEEMAIARRLDPGLVSAHEAAARQRAAAGDLAGAISEYQAALFESPGRSDLRVALATALSDKGDRPAAIAQLQQAVAAAPDDVPALINLGIELTDAGQVPEAITCLRHALTIQPDEADAHLNLGKALLAQNDRDGAAEQYRKAVESRPELFEGWFNLGVVTAAQGRLDEAEKALIEAVKLQPTDPDARQQLAAVQGRRRGAVSR